MQFVEFRKIPRLSREILVTEKLDGSNGQICIFSYSKDFAKLSDNQGNVIVPCDEETQKFIDDYCLARKNDLLMFAGSRNRWLSTGKQNDNHAFAYWVKENAEQLFELGEGRHFGEWYGKGIQRGYGLDHKRFALFNVSKWQNRGLRLVDDKQQYAPVPCEVVPILYEGVFDTQMIDVVLHQLQREGSRAVPGYNLPEGICVFHTASGQYFKKTIENDQQPKGVTNG